MICKSAYNSILIITNNIIYSYAYQRMYAGFQIHQFLCVCVCVCSHPINQNNSVFMTLYDDIVMMYDVRCTMYECPFTDRGDKENEWMNEWNGGKLTILTAQIAALANRRNNNNNNHNANNNNSNNANNNNNNKIN